jgi:hypothetical protein
MITHTKRINPTQEQRRILAKICAYEGPRTYLLSFPRSGNTWVRYCLEFLTQRPTIPRRRTHLHLHDFQHGHPLAWNTTFKIDEDKVLIEKIHRPDETTIDHRDNKKISLNRDTDMLLFILRNPKESITCAEYATFTEFLDAGWKGYCEHRVYFENLMFFDAWPADRRHLIYYEDLIAKPRETLAAILEFLQEPDTRLDQFMHDYQHHKETCLAIYPKPISRGNDPLFHSKKLSIAFRKKVDAWIAYAYPELWEKYLWRYTEQI